MKTRILFLLPLICFLVGVLAANVLFVQPVSAAPAPSVLQGQVEAGMKTVAKTAGYNEATTVNSLPTTIGKFIQIALGFLGVIMVVIIVYAGFLWMTAGGETDQIKKAKDWMINAVIGLLICVAAYSISSFVVAKIFEATA